MENERDTIPTEEDLLKLPRWACVAFAARCARRVQPFFAAWKSATQKQVDAVHRAITLAEASARVGRAEASLSDARAATRAANAADAVAACDAARAAAAAASTAAVYPTFAPRAARDAAAESEFADGDTAVIWSDYDRLLALATAEGWDDATPVDVNRLGPL
jgi:hypothetical protein